MRYYRFSLWCGIASMLLGVVTIAVGDTNRELSTLVIAGIFFFAVGAADIAVTVIRNHKASQSQQHRP